MSKCVPARAPFQIVWTTRLRGRITRGRKVKGLRYETIFLLRDIGHITSPVGFAHMKRKLQILIPGLLILLVVIWTFWPSSRPILIEGDISKADAAQIGQAVRGDMRRSLLTNFSIATSKQLPGNVLALAQYKIVAIQESGQGHCYVTLKRNFDSIYAHYLLFAATKQTNGWKVTSSDGPPWR